MRIAWGENLRDENMWISDCYLFQKRVTHGRVTVLAPDVLAVDVFGTGIFHWYLV
jgi:hypothetical protein